MAHGFLTPQDVSGESPLFGKIAKWLQDQWNKERETTKKDKEEVSGKLDTLQKTVDVAVRDVTNRQAPAYKMLRGNQPKALPSGTKALPPGGPRLPGSPDGPRKGGAITNLSGDGAGISADTFFNRAQSGVGASGEYLTNAQRREAFIKSRQEAVKTTAATNAPAISPDSGADIVAAVAKNTEAISTLVKVTKEQTSNDTKLSERSALTQEKLMGRQRSAAEERSLEEGKDMSGFLTPTMKKLEKQAKGGGGGGYDANMDRRNTASDLLDIGSDIMDTMGKGKVRRVTQGRDGRTSRQRLRDMRARRAGGGFKPRGKLGALSKLGGAATKGGGLSRLGGAAAKGGALGGLGGGLKGAARGLGKSGPLALLTAGLEFGDRMSSGQNAFQAGVGTAGSAGGGLAGAAAGAAIGSVIPGVGTVIGGLIGGMLGSMAGGGIADAATGANNIPSGAGGMLSSGPMSGYMSMLHGTELTLSGNNKKETKNIGEALGEGIIMASLGPLNPKVLELSAKGMKHFYENMGGKDIMENIFKGVTDALGAVGNMLGSVANSLLGGAANAGTMYGGGMSADEQQLTEALIAGEEGVKTEAYKDSEGIWTIGYGQTTLNGRAVKEGDKISKEEALSGFRSNLKSHAQRAINQVGEKRWQEMDPKMRAVLTSLAYNYGSIPDRVLQEAKTGTPEDLAKAMDKLYGDNDGDLKGRRQREQSILRGNMQGTAGNAVRLDKDFLAGGKFAGAGTGPSVMGAGPSNFQEAQYSVTGANKITRDQFGRRGFQTKDGLGSGATAFGHTGRDVGLPSGTPLSVVPPGTVVEASTGHNGGYGNFVVIKLDDGRIIKSNHHSRNLVKAGDRVGMQADGSVKPYATVGSTGLSTGPHMHLDLGTSYTSPSAAVGGLMNPDAFILGGGIVTGGNVAQATQTAAGSPGPVPPSISSATPLVGAAATPGSPVAGISPVAASPAAANTGTGVMQASAQTSGPVFQQPVTVVNNYNVAGAGGGGDVIPNTLGAGVSMDQMGLGSFSQLKIRSLG